jgi:hypothetical protein
MPQQQNTLWGVLQAATGRKITQRRKPDEKGIFNETRKY